MSKSCLLQPLGSSFLDVLPLEVRQHIFKYVIGQHIDIILFNRENYTGLRAYKRSAIFKNIVKDEKGWAKGNAVVRSTFELGSIGRYTVSKQFFKELESTVVSLSQIYITSMAANIEGTSKFNKQIIETPNKTFQELFGESRIVLDSDFKRALRTLRGWPKVLRKRVDSILVCLRTIMSYDTTSSDLANEIIIDREAYSGLSQRVFDCIQPSKVAIFVSALPCTIIDFLLQDMLKALEHQRIEVLELIFKDLGIFIDEENVWAKISLINAHGISKERYSVRRLADDDLENRGYRSLVNGLANSILDSNEEVVWTVKKIL